MRWSMAYSYKYRFIFSFFHDSDSTTEFTLRQVRLENCHECWADNFRMRKEHGHCLFQDIFLFPEELRRIYWQHARGSNKIFLKKRSRTLPAPNTHYGISLKERKGKNIDEATKLWVFTLSVKMAMLKISTMDRLCGLALRVPGYRSRGPGFDFRRYQIFREAVGLERGPLSLVRITEEILEWKSSDSGLENRDLKGRGDPLRWPRDTLYPQKLPRTSPTSGGRSVGIVRLRTKSHGVSFYLKVSNVALDVTCSTILWRGA
jgi:hypothetical protein